MKHTTHPAGRLPGAKKRPTPHQRRDVILKRVLAGEGDIASLAIELGTSTATIRRDLARLTEMGLVARTYGGAILQPARAELTWREKEATHVAEKEAIAEYMSSVIPDKALVFLDAGTTVAAAARRLRQRSGLTFLIAGLSSLNVLSPSDDNHLIVLGGDVRPASQGMTGPLAEAGLERISPDVALIGAEGVLAGRGISCPTLEQSKLKSLAMRQARAVYVLADHSKLGRAIFNFWAPLTEQYTLVTDSLAEPTVLASFGDAAVAVKSRTPTDGDIQSPRGMLAAVQQ